MFTNRTASRFAAAAALAVALSVASIPGATADGAAGPYPASAGKRVAAERPGDGEGGWQGDGLSLNPADNKKVDEFAARAKEAEESISPQLKAVALISHATLVGFDHRLKSADSLKRKVATSMKEEPGQTVDAALARINDSVRYTLQWTDGRYTTGVATASATLSGWGNDNVKWSNTWGRKNGYKGINSGWRGFGSGHPFEVQFHTPSSKWAQEATHKLYEEQRLPGTPKDRVQELQRQQDAIFASVPVPEGAEGLAAPAPPKPAEAEGAPAAAHAPPATVVPAPQTGAVRAPSAA
ncbi:ATP nucleotide 3'-pyrophosphokinase [Streptomyces sp. ISL-11]|uniref:ATP nucleotide 3'-pyrophosphokinase n=1 Tax=Streptomyces sp. ISL-11 TaxID=2819174 RepID=UPI001BE5996F|nr:ATP nucleotide 3'-pyrophosphokinase [Streptomyces sp. ISL-11]MBT2382165.1 ATP nucleotide 3'-pyrophosphokinase [Streptomyces sp. ISL-11]